MTLSDIGPQPTSFDLETATTSNGNYRTVAWTGTYLQVTLMSIPPGESIGLERHPETDQFLRLDAGQGKAQMGPAEEWECVADSSSVSAVMPMSPTRSSTSCVSV